MPYIQSALEIYNDDKERIATLNAVEIALRSTCQLYQNKKNRPHQIEANGCAILIEHAQNYYCISNAHVLTDNHLGTTFFLFEDGTKATVGGSIFYTRLPESGNRNDDKLDIAVVKLNQELVKLLFANGNLFYPSIMIKTRFSIDSSNILLVAGYPATKTKFDTFNKRLKFNPLILRTVGYFGNLSKLKIQKEFHHIIRYSRNSTLESTTQIKFKGPYPAGISGSGLWHLYRSSEEEYFPFLIGVMTEYDENKSVLISTKIDLFVELIKQKFDLTIINNGVRLDIIK